MTRCIEPAAGKGAPDRRALLRAGLAASALVLGCGPLAAQKRKDLVLAFIPQENPEKLIGDISPGVTITRAPILVQFHILVANAIGMRMQPCEAG